MEKFVDMLFRQKMGQNQGIPLTHILKAARDQSSKNKSISTSKEIVVDDLNTLFCSKTVAVTYKAAGLLAPNRKSERFVPKHFASEFDDFLDLSGASLGVEYRVTFESHRLKDAVHNVLNFPMIEFFVHGLGVNKEKKAALLVQKFVRRLAARKEIKRRQANQHKGNAALYAGAEEHGTKDRMSLLDDMAHQPHKKPADTLQLTWMDDDAASPTSKDLI